MTTGTVSSWRWLWPTISDAESAKKAARRGAWCALVVGAYATATTFYSSGHPRTYLYAIVFIVLGLYMLRISRVAATLTLVIYFALSAIRVFVAVGEWWLDHADTSITPFMVPIVIISILALYFVNSVRGTFAYHRFAHATTPRPIGSN
jgi:hypothetical protein